MSKMFCFQCEQTAGCSGCTGGKGACGKEEETARLQDELTGALIGLARAADGNQPSASTHRTMMEGLFATLTNVNFDNDSIRSLIQDVLRQKEVLIPECKKCTSVCDRNNDYDMKNLWEADADIRSLKSLLLFGLRGMAAYAYHALVLGYTDDTVNQFFYRGMFAVGEELGMDQLLPLLMEAGTVNLKCMELLDKANTESYGVPAPAEVSMNIETGPFIVVSGCDGARMGRSYFTDFVKKSPQDTIILTLACGKYRFHDLALGEIGGFPRIMDMGQCNDSFSAIKVAVALSEAFECSVNELPLSIVLSWYEQKAVCILLTLLSLGIKNIYLGPTLPAFLSENVLNYLVEHYNISPISTPEDDMKKMLKR